MLILFGVLIVGQGALRKWILPGLATPLYVAKDIALLGSLLLLSENRSLQLTNPLRRTLLPLLWGGFACIVFLQAFNLNVPSIAVGVLGIRSYLLYSTLLILLPMALQRVQRPKRLLLFVSLGLIVPVLLLGMYQYSQPVGSWINQYVADEAKTVGVLSRPRITGTFSYIGGMGAFLTFSLMAGIGVLLAGLRYQDRFYQVLGGGLLGLALVVAPMNGSRSVVLGPLIPLPFILYVFLRRRRGLAVGVSLLLLAGAGAYVASESGWVTRGWEIIEERMEGNYDELEGRMEGTVTGPLAKISYGGVLGYGAGSTHQAAGALSSEGRLRIGIGYEREIGRVLLELGVFGALVYLALKAWLAWIGWRALCRASSAWTSMLAVTSFSYLFLMLGTGMIVFNHVSGALYWICAGCAVWVWSRQEVQRHAPSPSTDRA